MLESKIPSGPIEQKWEKSRFEMKLVNPANRRKHSVIIVGSGLAVPPPLLRLASKVILSIVFASRQPPPRPFHCRAGWHQRRQELPQRR